MKKTTLKNGWLDRAFKSAKAQLKNAPKWSKGHSSITFMFLLAVVLLSGCATSGYVSTAVVYYDPYPTTIWVGPYPYPHYGYGYSHHRPHYRPPQHSPRNAPPVVVRPQQSLRQSPPARQSPPTRSQR